MRHELPDLPTRDRRRPLGRLHADHRTETRRQGVRLARGLPGGGRVSTVIFGGGEIAAKGIQPLVGGYLVPQAECDVTDYPAVMTLAARLCPDVVVYTAGVSQVAPVASSDPRAWKRELLVNLLGAYHVARACQTAHTMVFLASLAGLYGKPDHSGYSASKAGLISLVQSLAMEGHNAYCISPGRVDTR